MGLNQKNYSPYEEACMSFANRLRRIITLLFVFSFISAQDRDEVIELSYPVTGVIVDTSFVDVEITVADFFDIGASGCSDCDGYVQITMDGTAAGQITSDAAVTVTGLSEGSHFIEVEALDPTGASFSPAVYDSATFTVDMVSVPNLCPPRNLSVAGGDTRNFINWSSPIALSSLNPFPSVPQSVDYHTGSTDGSSFIQNSLIMAHGGSSTDKEAGWAIFDIAGMNPAVEVDSIIFHFYVSNTNWPYWSVTAVNIDPLTSSASDVHAEILSGTDAATAYLYRNEASSHTTGWYSDTFMNGANDDLENAIPQGYFVIGCTDRDGTSTYYLDIDGWNEANPPSLEIHWSAPGGRQGVYNAPAISDIPYSDEEITAYKNAVRNGLDVSEFLSGIGEYETVHHPTHSSQREEIEGCGDFQNFTVYSSDGTTIATVDTNFYLHEGLTNGTEYCYYVVANYSEGYSSTTGTQCGTPVTFDPEGPTNIAAVGLDEEIAVSWTDPSVPQYTFYENFNSGIPATWTVTDNNGSGIIWAAGEDGPSSYTLDDYDGEFAIATSYSNTFPNTDLISPSIDLSGYSSATAYYSFNYQDFAFNPTDSGLVYISGDGGSSWTRMNSYDADTPAGGFDQVLSDSVSLNSVVGNSDVKLKFHYEVESGESWFFSVDDIIVIGSETSRDSVDGDLMGYNVYVDNSSTPHNSSIIQETSYIADGLTNAQAYTVGVTAVYYPDFESLPIEATATPTWLYGDVSGTISDPNGNLLDSAVISIGAVSDITGADGVFLLEDLEPGEYTISVSRVDFEDDSDEITIVAQENAITQNFVLTPALLRADNLIASSGDNSIDLIWNMPDSSGSAGDLTGTWTLFFDWGCYGAPGSVEVEFSETGELILYGNQVMGNWYSETGTASLNAGGYGCDAIDFDYNAYFTFNYYSTIYYMEVDGDEFSGVITSGYGDHDGDNSGVRVTGRNIQTDNVNENSNTLLNLAFDLENTPETFLDEYRGVNNSIISSPSIFNGLQLNRSLPDSLIGYNIYQIVDSGDTVVATTTDPEDTTATITVPDNYTEYCYYVKARWVTDSYGILESKASNEACAIPFKLGDVDFNNDVDLSDLLVVVDYILEVSMPSEDQFNGADVNEDGQITINDVVMIVDIIYGTSGRMMSSVDDDVLVNLFSTEEQLLLSMDYEGLTRGVQFTLDASMSVEFGSPLLSVSDAGTMVMSNRSEDGKLSVVVVNTQGSAVERHEDVLVRIPYSFTGDRNDKASVVLHDVKAAGMAGESLPVTVGEKRIDISIVPAVFALHQNYPNPFNPVTEIQFDVPTESHVTLTIYNIMGQEVRTLSNSTLEAGFHSIRWDGTNESGELISTGVYFYRLTSPSFTSTKKMLMVK